MEIDDQEGLAAALASLAQLYGDAGPKEQREHFTVQDVRAKFETQYQECKLACHRAWQRARAAFASATQRLRTASFMAKFERPMRGMRIGARCSSRRAASSKSSSRTSSVDGDGSASHRIFSFTLCAVLAKVVSVLEPTT